MGILYSVMEALLGKGKLEYDMHGRSDLTHQKQKMQATEGASVHKHNNLFFPNLHETKPHPHLLYHTHRLPRLLRTRHNILILTIHH